MYYQLKVHNSCTVVMNINYQNFRVLFLWFILILICIHRNRTIMIMLYIIFSNYCINCWKNHCMNSSDNKIRSKLISYVRQPRVAQFPVSRFPSYQSDDKTAPSSSAMPAPPPYKDSGFISPGITAVRKTPNPVRPQEHSNPRHFIACTSVITFTRLGADRVPNASPQAPSRRFRAISRRWTRHISVLLARVHLQSSRLQSHHRPLAARIGCKAGRDKILWPSLCNSPQS